MRGRAFPKGRLSLIHGMRGRAFFLVREWSLFWGASYFPVSGDLMRTLDKVKEAYRVLTRAFT